MSPWCRRIISVRHKLIHYSFIFSGCSSVEEGFKRDFSARIKKKAEFRENAIVCWFFQIWNAFGIFVYFPTPPTPCALFCFCNPSYLLKLESPLKFPLYPSSLELSLSSIFRCGSTIPISHRKEILFSPFFFICPESKISFLAPSLVFFLFYISILSSFFLRKTTAKVCYFRTKLSYLFRELFFLTNYSNHPESHHSRWYKKKLLKGVEQ